MKKLLELYAKWKMRRTLYKFNKAWSQAEQILVRTGWPRYKRRQLRRELLKGQAIDLERLKEVK